jgi:asparaginyl-tRNA synthetase
MAETIRVSDISKYIGQEVTVQGWVYNRTDKGKLVFLLVRDGSGFVQCVAFKGDLEPEVFDRVSRLPQESSVIITGPVREDKRAPGIPGGYESE